MKKDLCWEKSFVRNSYDEVCVIDSWFEILIIKQPVLKIKSRVLRTGYSCIYVHLIHTPLNICAYLLYMPILQIGFSLLAYYSLSKSGLNRLVRSIAWSNSHWRIFASLPLSRISGTFQPL